MSIFVYVFMFGLIIAMTRVVYLYTENQVSDRLREDRLEPVTVKFNMWKGSRYKHHVDFVARTAKGKRITGHAIKYAGNIDMFYEDGFDRLENLREIMSSVSGMEGRSQVLVDPGMDLETRIQFETNQRLERIQGDRESFLANDLNSDGVIDAQEWDIVRERIAAEVRAELSGHPSDDDEVEFIEESPAEELVEEELDGHW